MPTLLDARLRYCPTCPISDRIPFDPARGKQAQANGDMPGMKVVYDMNRADTDDARKLSARLRQARSRAKRLFDDAIGKMVKR